ncbi:hypothetical protein BGZ63DRAFT_431463 [Mariannaea sp. PMI_226]|nr:hypothetical protein BGZ63DRAFT_431463 [Mariannaea sp. PMI_226]
MLHQIMLRPSYPSRAPRQSPGRARAPMETMLEAMLEASRGGTWLVEHPLRPQLERLFAFWFPWQADREGSGVDYRCALERYRTVSGFGGAGPQVPCSLQRKGTGTGSWGVGPHLRGLVDPSNSPPPLTTVSWPAPGSIPDLMEVDRARSSIQQYRLDARSPVLGKFRGALLWSGPCTPWCCEVIVERLDNDMKYKVLALRIANAKHEEVRATRCGNYLISTYLSHGK